MGTVSSDRDDSAVGSHTCMKCNVFGHSEGEAAHNACNMGAVAVAVVRVAVTINRVGMQSPGACTRGFASVSPGDTRPLAHLLVNAKTNVSSMLP